MSSKGEYEGGLIFPGIRLALASLSAEAALLPKVELKASKVLIGRDTKTSMNNGILYGYASMCDGIIDKLKKEYSRNIKVIATGGDASLISRYSKQIKNVHPDLILEGLKLLTR